MSYNNTSNLNPSSISTLPYLFITILNIFPLDPNISSTDFDTGSDSESNMTLELSNPFIGYENGKRKTYLFTECEHLGEQRKNYNETMNKLEDKGEVMIDRSITMPCYVKRCKKK